MAYLYDLTDTWNAAGTVFNAIKMNVTNTASAAGSKIVSLQVGSTDRFTVDKDGNGYFSGALQAVGSINSPNAYISGNSGTIGMQDNTASIMAYNATGSGGITNTLRFITGAAERVRIDGSGSLLVGTATNTYGYAGSPSIELNGTDAALVALKKGGAAGSYISHNNTLNIFNTTANPIVLATSNTERMRIDASGNVLIGTTTAVDNNLPLELNAGASGLRGMGINNNGGYGVYLTYDNTGRYATAGAAIRNIANSPLYFETNNTLRATLDASGNLGLGVTPSAWLSAYKAFELTGGAIQGGTATTLELYQNSYRDASGNRVYKTTNPASRYVQDSGYHYWYTAPSGTAGNAISFTQAMTLDASGNLLVGTTSGLSGAKTEIRQNADANYSTTFTTGTTKNLLTLRDLSDVGTYSTPFSTLAFAAGSSGAAWATITGVRTASQSSAITFGTANGSGNTEERARIDSSGNVGLGVTPSAWYTGLGLKALQVGEVALVNQTNGYSWLQRNAFADASNVQKYITNGYATRYQQGDGAHIWQTAPSGTAGNAITFTQAATLSSASNVTTYKLATAASGAGATQGFDITFANDAYLWNYQSGTIIFATNNTERMRLDASGNLGIGTTPSATTRLHVAAPNTAGNDNTGNVYIATTDAQAADVGGKLTFGGFYNGASTYAFGGIAGRKENSTSNNVAGYLQLLTTSSAGALTERARIDSSGNVLIGTTTAVDNNFPLELNAGTSSVRGMGVNNNGGYGVYLTYDNTNRYATNGAAIRNVANSPLYFETNNTLRATLDASGNLGLGVTPSAWGSVYKGFQIGQGGMMSRTGGSDVYLLANNYYDGTNFRYINPNPASRYEQDIGVHRWFTAPSGTAGNAISFTQAMTLDASGNLTVGTGTNAVQLLSSKTIQFYNTGSSDGFINSADDTSSFNSIAFNKTQLKFYTGNSERARIDSSGNLLVGKTAVNATTIGAELRPDGQVCSALSSTSNLVSTLNVYSTGAAAYRFYVDMTGTVFATSTTISAISDIRLKENVRELDAGLDVILALKPRRFDWKEGKGKDVKDDMGFIAQEVEEVLPALIGGWKAGEGEPDDLKSVKAGDLIPVLVKAIQELTARVAQLEGN